MKSFKLIAMFLLLCVTWTSCIQDEAPNAEADITACILPQEILLKPNIDVTRSFDSEMNAYPIYISIKNGIDITKLAPEFELTEGATINPESGSIHNFNEKVYYKVTSEDKQWTRDYVLVVEQQKPVEPEDPDVPEQPDQPEDKNQPTYFHFEKFKPGKGNKYQILYEEFPNRTIDWGSGNEGFNFAVSTAKPHEYPTYISSEGVVGNCVKMVTQSTGKFGEMVKMPIASGNLFLGYFDFTNAVTKPLQATKFGEPWYKLPKRIKGYYQYKAGEKFVEKGKEVKGKKDICSIYAVFYELTPTSDNKTGMLDGSIEVRDFKDPSMIAVAIVKDVHETEPNKWQQFDVEFDYKRYNKEIDTKKLAEGSYYLGIVLAASKDGANFNGAVGSTLLVDEIEVNYE